MRDRSFNEKGPDGRMATGAPGVQKEVDYGTWPSGRSMMLKSQFVMPLALQYPAPQ